VTRDPPDASGVVRVRTDLVLDQLVSRLLGRAIELSSGEFDQTAENVLAEAPEPIRLARLGYASRVAETEMFEPARRAMPWLAELSNSGSPTAEICRALAADEPDDKPDPDEGSWRVPGPGGHVRHFLALAAADEVMHGDSNGQPAAARELSPGEAKRCFLYGFYLRCFEEGSTPPAE